MAISKDNSSIDFYRNKSKFKWVILIVSIIISAVSIYYTNILVDKLKHREQKLISLYANTLEYVANQPSNSDFNFIFEEIIVSNKSIPVIVTDEIGRPVQFRNIPKAERAGSKPEREKILREELAKMEAVHEPILITLRTDGNISGYQIIYYKNSLMLSQLKYYPIVQLLIIAIFGLITFLIFNYSKSSEQDRVWVGMAKETAHQLGTPLSSLMAWVEYLKADETMQNKEMIFELEKDIERLNMITSRFSNIGSEPLLESTNVYDVVNNTIEYLKKRVSTKVEFTITTFPNRELEANLNTALFEWVIENICKNAVDAMVGEGKINIKILKANEGHTVIDISDTGKGISKSKIQKIFEPGFSTKKRGWGLGLTLVKRIIESYHRGKIYVKSSDPNNGTTFRISLKS